MQFLFLNIDIFDSNWFARFIVVQKVWMGKVLASWSDLHFFLESNRSRMGEGDGRKDIDTCLWMERRQSWNGEKNTDE